MLNRRAVGVGLGSTLLAGAASAAEPSDLTGTWAGALAIGSQRLRLQLELSAGGAVLVSVDQGGARIPGMVKSLTPTSVDLSFPSVSARFVGRLNARGALEGVFTQGAALPLTFVRGEEAPAAPAAKPLDQETLAALRKAAGSPALIAAASRRGSPSPFWIDGERSIGSGVAITRDDLWHIGSLTKSMTATLVARCVEAGLVSWDDTVGAALGQAAPSMRPEYASVTFRHLCSHRSGLPENIPLAEFVKFPRESGDARADRVAYAKIALAQAPVGQKEATFQYSNSGFILAGAMLEAKLGAPWERIVTERLFKPLGLDTAGFGAPGTPKKLDQPVGHAQSLFGRRKAYPPGGPITDNPAVLGPAGRVHLSAADMIRYLNAHRDRSGLLAKSSWDLLHTPPFGGEYAMGWVVHGSVRWHNGSNTLWYAEAQFDDAAGVSAFAATNDGVLAKATSEVGAALLGAAAAA